MVNQPQEYATMAQVEGDHWWYRTLHHQVAAALAALPAGRAARVIDAGCGTGGLLLFLQRQGYCHLAGFDVSAHALAIGRNRGLTVEQCDLRELDETWFSKPVDAIICNDALYFLTDEEQSRLMRRCGEALTPGGLLILNLPALAVFRGIHDLSVGIQRRFTKADIPRLLTAVEFEVMQARYWPFLLAPFVYYARLAQRMRMRCTAGFAVKSDLHRSLGWGNNILAGINRLELAFPPRAPFGSSLFLVARKRG